MKYKKVLITGGAGFIGSHLTDALLKKGCQVRIFDNLEHQVHQGIRPTYFNQSAEFIEGDVRDIVALRKAIDGIDVIYHEAAAVGVGQSQYEIKRYVDVNVSGTANILDILVNDKHRIKKIIITTSMTGYGEGNYRCKKCGVVRPTIREEKQLQMHDWEPHCPFCRTTVKSIPTTEDAYQFCTNIYALTKRMQEDMVLGIGKTYSLPAVALRCFNVYGPRQSLSNPYTGVSAIFISRIKNNRAPVVYEDGMQTRDFISVYDVVRANILALESDKVNFEAINIGSGEPVPIAEVAKIVARLLGKKITPEITGKYRKNDLRHCFADISKAKKLLNWSPKVSFEQGMKDLISWAEHEAASDRVDEAIEILKKKGLSA